MWHGNSCSIITATFFFRENKENNLQIKGEESPIITALRPMTMETRCSKVFFPNYSKKKPAEDTVGPPLWGTREKNVFLGLFVHAAVRGGTCAFTLKTVTLIKNSSRNDRPSISTQYQPTANSLRVGLGR